MLSLKDHHAWSQRRRQGYKERPFSAARISTAARTTARTRGRLPEVIAPQPLSWPPPIPVAPSDRLQSRCHPPFPSHNVRCAERSGQKAQKSWGFSPDHKGLNELKRELKACPPCWQVLRLANRFMRKKRSEFLGVELALERWNSWRPRALARLDG